MNKLSHAIKSIVLVCSLPVLISCKPQSGNLAYGAVYEDNTLYISIRSDKAWEGRIALDTPRSKENLNLPIDWPRINQFPEWYTVSAGKKYQVRNHNSSQMKLYSGMELAEGIEVHVSPERAVHLEIAVQ